MLQPSSLLTGQLFTYGPNRVAFESLLPSVVAVVTSPSSTTFPVQQLPPPNKCILLGGLSDGLIPVPYTHALSEMVCHFPHQPGSLSCRYENSVSEPQPPSAVEQTWSLIQPILSSSYTGFGHGTLDRDVMELHELIQYLHQYRNATQNIVLIGHSTGCQQILHYFNKYNHQNTHVTAAVLQAPVSDREAATIWNPNDSLYSSAQEHQEQLQQYIALAKDMKEIKNQGNEMMPRNAFWAPISANRYYDLMVRKLGLDDYFSSDYTDEELQARLSMVSSSSTTSKLRRVIVAYSGQDEYVPKQIDTELLIQRLCHAMNHRNHINNDAGDEVTNTQPIAQPLYIPLGNHNLSSNNGADAKVLIQRIYELLDELTLK